MSSQGIYQGKRLVESGFKNPAEAHERAKQLQKKGLLTGRYKVDKTDKPPNDKPS